MPLMTYRTKMFLCTLAELYRAKGGPVHYSGVATRLGVNRFSAYDMLKAQEDKGYTSPWLTTAV